MVNLVQEYTDDAWKRVKKANEETHNTPTRVLDFGKQEAVSEMERRFADRKGGEISLQSMYLWNLKEAVWQGPMNLSFHGELQRFLKKHDEEGRRLYALAPPSESPALVAHPDQSGQAQADPQRGGRRRRHRGRRRQGDGR